MSQQDNFDRIVSALHDAALDDTLWPSASALIDEAVGMAGSHLIIVSGHSRDDAEFIFGDMYCHGELSIFGAEYATTYFSHDERFPRLFHLPDSQVFHVSEVFPSSTLKTSPVYNEGLRRFGARNGLNLRMDGPAGLHIAWAFTDSLDSTGWRSEQVTFITSLLPHIRQFVRVRQALARAEALHTSLTQLLDNALIGVLSLNRHGTIVETNALGLRILRRSDGVVDRDGGLRARFPTDDATLQRLIGRALPRWGQTVSGGSMQVRRSPRQTPTHPAISVRSLTGPTSGRSAWPPSSLLVDPGERPRIDPRLPRRSVSPAPKAKWRRP